MKSDSGRTKLHCVYNNVRCQNFAKYNVWYDGSLGLYNSLCGFHLDKAIGAHAVSQVTHIESGKAFKIAR